MSPSAGSRARLQHGDYIHEVQQTQPASRPVPILSSVRPRTMPTAPAPPTVYNHEAFSEGTTTHCHFPHDRFAIIEDSTRKSV